MYRNLWTVSIILFLLGIAGKAAGLFLHKIEKEKQNYPNTAEARVVAIVPKKRVGKDALTEYQNAQAAVFEFFVEGHLVKVTDSSNAYPCPYRMNERVWINYDPRDPQKFCIMKKNRWMIAAALCSAAGTGLIIAGVAVFLLYAGIGGRDPE